MAGTTNRARPSTRVRFSDFRWFRTFAATDPPRSNPPRPPITANDLNPPLPPVYNTPAAQSLPNPLSHHVLSRTRSGTPHPSANRQASTTRSSRPNTTPRTAGATNLGPHSRRAYPSPAIPGSINRTLTPPASDPPFMPITLAEMDAMNATPPEIFRHVSTFTPPSNPTQETIQEVLGSPPSSVPLFIPPTFQSSTIFSFAPRPPSRQRSRHDFSQPQSVLPSSNISERPPWFLAPPQVRTASQSSSYRYHHQRSAEGRSRSQALSQPVIPDATSAITVKIDLHPLLLPSTIDRNISPLRWNLCHVPITAKRLTSRNLLVEPDFKLPAIRSSGSSATAQSSTRSRSNTMALSWSGNVMYITCGAHLPITSWMTTVWGPIAISKLPPSSSSTSTASSSSRRWHGSSTEGDKLLIQDVIQGIFQYFYTPITAADWERAMRIDPGNGENMMQAAHRRLAEWPDEHSQVGLAPPLRRVDMLGDWRWFNGLNVCHEGFLGDSFGGRVPGTSQANTWWAILNLTNLVAA